MWNRKAVDLTIGTIVIAAIGLLVLVVLIAVFTGRLGIFTQNVQQAQGDASKCQALCSSGGYGLGTFTKGATSCATGKQVFGVFQDSGACCCATSSSSGQSSGNAPAVSGQ